MYRIKSFISFLLSALLLIALSPKMEAQAQKQGEVMTVKGEVVDSKGIALPGVTIMVLETRRGLTTDLDGKFAIKVKRGQRLRFSFIGMKRKVVKVKTATMKIVLRDNVQALDETIITGYQKIKNRVYTGAASSVKVEDIKLEGIPDISRMLEGRIAGLSIQNVSGSFGSAPRINIRGGASIIGNVQPLWVIDGVVFDDLVPISLDQLASGDAVTLISSAIAGLNPADIQDIQVLKDASATSVYGARALNGVIVVSTKSARRDSPLRINYNFEGSIRQRPSYKHFDLLGSEQTMDIYEEMARKGYFSMEQALYGRRSGVYYQMYHDITTLNPKTGKFLLPNTAEARANFLAERGRANTDWFKELFTLNPIANHSLSFSSGSKKTASYASLAWYDDAGWTITDKVNRFTAKLKTDFFINDKFTSRLTIEGNMRKQKATGTIPQKKNTVLGGFERDFDINPFSYALGTSRTLSPYAPNGDYAYYRNNWAKFNILNEYEHNYMNIDVLDFKVQNEITYKPIKGLELKALFALRQAKTSTSHYIEEGSNVIGAWRANENALVAKENFYLLKDNNALLARPEVALTHGGIFNKTETSLRSILGRFSADYHKRLGEHDIKLFAFSEIRSADREITPFQGYGIQYDKGNQIFTNPLVFNKLINEGKSYFGLNKRYDRGITFSTSATYGYEGKYIANFVFNIEGSNASGSASRAKWLPTWNIGGKWNIDGEDFLKDVHYLSRFALRASYGLTAKMNEEAINSQAVFVNGIMPRPDFDDRENILKIIHLENRDLTWEKMYELNVGLELGFLDNDLTATLDVYQRNAFDLIDLIRTSGVGGQYYKYANFGDMRTRGVELSLQGKLIKTKDFSWTAGLTFSYMNQKITRLLNAPNTFDMVAGQGRGNIVGFPKGSLFSFNFQGLNTDGLPTFNFGLYPQNISANSAIAGADFLDTEYSKTYLIYNGAIEPNITGGLSNTLRYKNWDFSCFITMQAGNKIRLNPTFDPEFKDLNVFSGEYYNRWLNPLDELKTDVPVIPSQDLIRRIGRENITKAYNTYNYSQERVADGSFVRLKNVSLGYRLDKELCKKMSLEKFAIKLNVTNPFLIYSDSKLRGQDPEYYKSGGVSLPTPQQYTLTLSLGF